ncbi:MAG: ABC transporter permease [Longimicrobiales bacterium]
MLSLEILMVALSAIRANLMRSALTTLGIVIGVSAVIAMVALGEGAQRQVEEQIERMGTNVLTIRAGQRFFGGVSTGDSEDLRVEDAEALRDEPGGVLTISPEVSSRSQLAYLRWNSSNDVKGVWPEYFGIYSHTLEYGRLFTQGEVQGRRRVVVLGFGIPEKLGTPAEILVGNTIQINGQPFEVIGILAEKGETSFYFRPDDWAFIPTSTAQFRLFGGRGQRLSSIYAQVPSAEFMDEAFADIDQVLRREHRIRPGKEIDFSIRNSSDLVATFNETTQTFTLLLAGIAGISLLVGGIGIMNIMLVSVTERTREIGVRMALGATRRAIMLQFLIEALVLCALGGLLGVIAGFTGARLMTEVANWQTVVAPSAIMMALGFSVGIGLFFGIWPARRAARMDPIDALRYE